MSKMSNMSKMSSLIQLLNSFEVSFQFGSLLWNCTLPEWQLVSFAGPAACEHGFSFVLSSAYAVTTRHQAWIALCMRHEAPIPEGASLARKQTQTVKQYQAVPQATRNKTRIFVSSKSSFPFLWYCKFSMFYVTIRVYIYIPQVNYVQVHTKNHCLPCIQLWRATASIVPVAQQLLRDLEPFSIHDSGRGQDANANIAALFHTTCAPKYKSLRNLTKCPAHRFPSDVVPPDWFHMFQI